MAEKLFIKPSIMTETTILGGNVDVDKYAFCIADSQMSLIEPLLGTLLYDKMITDLTDPITYVGDYLTLYNDYIVPIVKHDATARYIEIAGVMLNNGGLYKHTADNAETLDKDDTYTLSNKWRAFAQMHVLRFNKWICKNVIAEYKTYQDEVNASKTIDGTSGWWFGDEPSEDKLYE
jgi:hypothetical protein